MKEILSLISAIVLCVSTFAQNTNVCLSTNKTTTLIFPFPVIHVDKGSKDLLAEQINEAKNIILLKAACTNFDSTNITVITSDGSTYPFQISYAASPAVLLYKLPVQMAASFSTYADGILANPKTMHRTSSSKWDVCISLSGIFIKANTIFYQVAIRNYSPIDYDIDFIKFYIRDKKKAKRTAMQEIELKPVYSAGNIKTVKAYQKTMAVFALEKFIIPDAKYLAIEMMEKNGGRNLLLKISNKNIMKAIQLPDLH